MRLVTVAWIAGLFVVPLGCGNSFEEDDGGSGASAPAPPCNEDPWSCPASQTCWVAPDYTYQCLNQGPGAVGAACTPTIGTAPCNEGLFCASVNMVSPTCVPFCDNTDPNRACAGGTSCRMAQVQDVVGVISICVP